MVVAEAIDDLIIALEARAPASIRAPVNKRYVREIEKMMRKYFDDLEQAFPQEDIKRIYNKYVEED